GNGEHVMSLFEEPPEWHQYARTYSGIAELDQENLMAIQHCWYTDEYMNKTGTWGDLIVIWAFSQVYKTDIQIFSSDASHPYVIQAKDGKEARYSVKLGYMPHVHFVSLIKQSDTTMTRKKGTLGDSIDKCKNKDAGHNFERPRETFTYNLDHYGNDTDSEMQTIAEELQQEDIEDAMRKELTGRVENFLTGNEIKELNDFIDNLNTPKHGNVCDFVNSLYTHIKDDKKIKTNFSQELSVPHFKIVYALQFLFKCIDSPHASRVETYVRDHHMLCNKKGGGGFWKMFTRSYDWNENGIW
ncbi:unnamed protein product, partial [Owenia fusiformis]